jgi:polyketide synthase PksJ
VDWQSFHRDARRRRVVLPTYPFERKRFWVDRPLTISSPGKIDNAARSPAVAPDGNPV